MQRALLPARHTQKTAPLNPGRNNNGGIQMNCAVCIALVVAVLTVAGIAGDLIGIALGLIDPWDFK